MRKKLWLMSWVGVAAVVLEGKLTPVEWWALDMGPHAGWFYSARTFIFVVVSGIIFMAICSAPVHREIGRQKIPAALLGLLILHVLLTILAFVAPELFMYLSLEDRLAEMLSAFFCFTGAGVLFYSAWLLKKNAHKSFPGTAVLCAGAALLILWVGLEEVSWFQRVFVYETPQILQGNSQQEANIHNLATDVFEVVYYFGSFLGMILAPFIFEMRALPEKWKGYSSIIPGRLTIVAAALSAGYNFDMWDDAHIQIAFFITFFILLYYAFWENKKGASLLFRIYAFVFLVSQMAFLAGLGGLASWEAMPEYKEFYISLALMFYAFEVRQKAAKFSR